MGLGKFGTPRPAVEETFDWFGVETRVHPDLSDLAIMDMFGALANPEDGAAAVNAMRDLAASLVHPDDLEAFWKTARANRQTMSDIAELAASLIGAISGRPTRLPSDSSDGQQNTSASSEDDSSLRALHMLEGRPDLQVAVLRAQEAG
jgi:hypothetical protein